MSVSGDSSAIRITGLYKSFALPHERASTIKGSFVNIFSTKGRSIEKQSVLNDINIDVKPGEFLGIIGRNGSGKSTLLKIIAGIYSPDKGSVEIHGKLTPFIELGVGFNPELSGRDNVYLNGALLGFSRKEMDAMYDEIVSFAELEKSMDQKLKNYSSGMQVRLAFSIAIRAKSDILLLDEVLAVGDAAFQQKCYRYFEKLKQQKQTVVFISHDMEAVSRFCNRVIVIDKSRIVHEGSVRKATKIYQKILGVYQQGKVDKDAPLGMSPNVPSDRNHLTIEKVSLLNAEKRVVDQINDEDSFYLKVDMRALKNVKSPVPGVLIFNELKQRIVAANSDWANFKLPDMKKDDRMSVFFQIPNTLESGSYYIGANVVSSDLTMFYDWKNNSETIRVVRSFLTGGVVNLPCEVSVSRIENGKK